LAEFIKELRIINVQLTLWQVTYRVWKATSVNIFFD
jgi:hypothetical protein